MNYLLHNLGYDKPVNFREIVLRTYHKRCVWLRDICFDRLDLYNYEKWLPDIQYYYNLLLDKESHLEKSQNELASLTDDKLQEMYLKKVSDIQVLHNCHHSYHMDLAVDIKRCTDEYDKYLRKWLDIPNTPKWLTADLIDIYDCAMRDLEEHNDEDKKTVERMHKEVIPTFEDFKTKIINHLESSIEFQKDQIKSLKKTIKIVKQEIADVKQIFAWLDEVESEMKSNVN